MEDGGKAYTIDLHLNQYPFNDQYQLLFIPFR
jgi:hypothetical protein